MKRLHCDGCGITEEIDQPRHKITQIELKVLNDPRWESTIPKHDADLCPTCLGMMLHQFFNIPAEGGLELPAFISPVARLDEHHSRKVS